MNRNFSLTESGRKRAKISMFRKMLMPFLIFEIILVIGLIIYLKLDLLQSLLVVALFIIMLQIFTVRTLRNPLLNFSDWGLHVDDDSIYLTESPQDTEIKRENVASIKENDDGLLVISKGTGRRIWVPAGVEDYSTIKQTLNSWVQQNR